MPLGLRDLLTAIGLVLVIEGALMALFPERLKKLAATMTTQAPQGLRIAGLVAAALGVGVVWLIRG